MQTEQVLNIFLCLVMAIRNLRTPTRMCDWPYEVLISWPNFATFKYKCQLNGPKLTFEKKYASLKKKGDLFEYLTITKNTDWQNHSFSLSEIKLWWDGPDIYLKMPLFISNLIVCFAKTLNKIKNGLHDWCHLLCFSWITSFTSYAIVA